MADGYGTGMSARPLDFASGGLAFFNSAIQARKQEIQSHMVEATKNQELMLKAMDMKGLGEVAGKARDRMDNEINTFRSELVDRYKRSQGKLTSGDRIWMEGKSIDIQNNIDLAKNQLAALEKAKLMITPDKWNSYDDHIQLMKDITDDEKRIGDGDKYVNPLNTVMKHFRQPTPEEILAKRITDLKVKFDTAPVKKDNGDGTYTVTNKLTPSGLEAIKTAIGNDPVITKVFTGVDKNGQPYVDESRIDTAIENMYGESGTIRYKPKATGSGAGAVGNNLSTVDMDFGGGQYNVAKIDTPRTYTGMPAAGKDTNTGADVPAGGTSLVTVIGPGISKKTGDPVMLLNVKNPGIANPIMIGGKPAYKGESDSWKDINPASISDIKSDPGRFYTMDQKLKQTSSDGREFDKSKYRYEVKQTPSGVEITAYGTVPAKERWLRSSLPEVEEKIQTVVLKPAKSTEAVQTVEVPLTPQTYGFFEKALGKKTINGMPASQYLQSISKQAPAATRNTSTKGQTSGSTGGLY